MRNDGGELQGGVPRNGRSNGILPTSFRALSSYFRIVSSGASSVASTVRSAASAASAIVDKDNDASHNQVLWAGFDKLECEGNTKRQVLLLGYRYGFQVWDVQEADNVFCLVSRHDGPVSFLQLLPKPIASKQSGDEYADSRPLLVICSDESFSKGTYFQDRLATPCNGNMQSCHDQLRDDFVPTVVWFFSLRSQSYVHELKFRSVVYLVRCSSRVVAVLQATQIHCFDAATLAREYTILTNLIVPSCPGVGGIGVGPLAVGPRWMAYSGSPVADSNSARVSPQDMTPMSYPGPASNGSLVAHYAKESSKQLAAGIVILGDKGYKTLSRYYSELLPDGKISLQPDNPSLKVQGTSNGHLSDSGDIGMVIVRDIVSKSVIAQFRAHKSPISALCFDPSGTILVTASVQGHNINVFRIMPGSSGSDAAASYSHLYHLQRGFTNAVIQDISFSNDSRWIMISSTRGTCHLFAISPSGGSFNIQYPDASFASKRNGPVMIQRQTSSNQTFNQQNFYGYGSPITLSAVSRIRAGSSVWRNAVSGAAAAATGRVNNTLAGAVASVFHNAKSNDLYANATTRSSSLLVFSPSGCMIQYALRILAGVDPPSVNGDSRLSTGHDSGLDFDASLVVEAIQKWNICHRQNRREREDHNFDIYGENGKVFPEGMEKEKGLCPEGRKVNSSGDESRPMYISEAELQVHQDRYPLWANPRMYFQSMILDNVELEEADCSVGEIEIEKISTRVIEARSKDLVPVFDYVKTSNLQQGRIPALDTNENGQIPFGKTGFSENEKLPRSSHRIDSTTNCGISVVEFNSGVKGTRSDGLSGFVNTDVSPKSDHRLDVVNNGGESSSLFKFVHNNIEDLKSVNQAEDEEEDEVD